MVRFGPFRSQVECRAGPREVIAGGRQAGASVEPSIFGTLFERTLDPAKRSQIGAHYTSRADIETLLKPVLLAPLEREWAEVKRKCEEELWPKVVKASRVGQAQRRPTKTDSPARKAFDRAILDFTERLAHVKVLDAACGSGNFLYVAIHMLLDLEKEVIAYASDRGLSPIPQVNPAQLHGLEINPYAQELAQVVVWIGYLQWMHYNGFKMPDHPVLTPIETIRQMDAILDLSDPEHPKEPEWPEAEFIVGNPPFLGGNKVRSELGDNYVDRLFQLYDGRLSAFCDLCCYWFEKARGRGCPVPCRRAGFRLPATRWRRYPIVLARSRACQLTEFRGRLTEFRAARPLGRVARFGRFVASRFAQNGFDGIPKKGNDVGTVVASKQRPTSSAVSDAMRIRRRNWCPL